MGRSWVTDRAMAMMAAGGTAVTAYWQAAPAVMQVAILSLAPMIIVDSLSAGWLQRRLLRRDGLTQEQIDFLSAVDPRDTWRRVATRFAMTLGLVVLAGVTDAITGTPHMTVCWVLLWAVGGHGQQTLRRFRLLAHLEGFELPIFPDGAWEKVNHQAAPAPREGLDD